VSRRGTTSTWPPPQASWLCHDHLMSPSRTPICAHYLLTLIIVVSQATSAGGAVVGCNMYCFYWACACHMVYGTSSFISHSCVMTTSCPPGTRLAKLPQSSLPQSYLLMWGPPPGAWCNHTFLLVFNSSATYVHPPMGCVCPHPQPHPCRQRQCPFPNARDDKGFVLESNSPIFTTMYFYLVNAPTCPPIPTNACACACEAITASYTHRHEPST
jgi:hypothetical protein